MKKLNSSILPIVKTALQEDIGKGDITTRLLVPDKKVKAQILAKQDGIICGLDIARLVFKAVDKKTRLRCLVSDGARVKEGEILVRLQGKAVSILTAERVALNFLSHLSGIASKTNQYVQKIKPHRAKIMDTRKTTPGLRILEKYAVRCGGGTNHRIGLWDQVLIKDNHLAVCGQQLSASSLKKLLSSKPKGMKVEIEVKTLRQFKQVLPVKPDIIMLDNFSLANIKKAVKLNAQKLEVSGGVNLSNVRQIAATGVERISIGELTHSAPALDIALNCEKF
ncbi:carboxylating nicotinate-nucleotide diphosphorylase [Candidatus Omnitrophota bacterium]